MQGERRNHRAHARAVGHARIHNGRRIVDAAADRGDDALDDHAHVRLVFEAHVGFHHAARALDVDVVEAVDHDVADGGIFEQRFERAEAEDFVEDLFDQPLALGHGHGQRFVEDQLLHHRADLAADAVLVEVLELIGRERIEELRSGRGVFSSNQRSAPEPGRARERLPKGTSEEGGWGLGGGDRCGPSGRSFQDLH